MMLVPDMQLLSDDFPTRLRTATSWAWRVLARKIAHGQVNVNREASLQLHYAACLQQVLPLLSFGPHEAASIELETAARVGNRPHNIDLVVSGMESNQTGATRYRIAVEMKCYRIHAASGGKRGATDIFMKDVYEDLAVLEDYCAAGVADAGVALVMTEYRGFVFPPSKAAKCWAYDISHGASVGPTRLDIPIGGRGVDITLRKRYTFAWEELGDFFFLELEGKSAGDMLLTSSK